MNMKASYAFFAVRAVVICHAMMFARCRCLIIEISEKHALVPFKIFISFENSFSRVKNICRKRKPVVCENQDYRQS